MEYSKPPVFFFSDNYFSAHVESLFDAFWMLINQVLFSF